MNCPTCKGVMDEHPRCYLNPCTCVAPMSDTTTRPCALCDEPTTGSVGAAGIKWSAICQPCKDREDRIALKRVHAMGLITDLVIDLFEDRRRG